MRQHDHAGVLLANEADLGCGKALMDLAMPGHAMISTPVSAATFCARYSSGSMITDRPRAIQRSSSHY